jgi:PmbA protein
MDALNDQLKALAKKHDAGYELTIDTSDSFSATYQQRKLHKYKVDHTRSASVRVLQGTGAGFAVTENLAADSLEQTFLEALETAKQMAAYNKNAATQDQIYFTDEKTVLADLQQPLILSADQKLKLAQELEESALSFDPRITNVPYSGLQERSGTRTLYNSKDLARHFPWTSVYASCSALAKQGTESQDSYEAQFFRTDKNLNAQAIGQLAAKKALSHLGSKPIPTGQYAVVFCAEVVASMLGFLIDHLNAQSIDERTSPTIP